MSNKATKKGTKVYVCATAQNADLDQAGYEALTWVRVGKVGSVGDFGATSNISQYDTYDEDVSQNQKGTAKAGDPQLECASVYNDAGQIILRSFGNPLEQDNMAIKIERNDAPSGLTNTIFYSRGVVSGPLFPGGGSDDFELERFTLALNQLAIRVDPA